MSETKKRRGRLDPQEVTRSEIPPGLPWKGVRTRDFPFPRNPVLFVCSLPDPTGVSVSGTGPSPPQTERGLDITYRLGQGKRYMDHLGFLRITKTQRPSLRIRVQIGSLQDRHPETPSDTHPDRLYQRLNRIHIPIQPGPQSVNLFNKVVSF